MRLRKYSNISISKLLFFLCTVYREEYKFTADKYLRAMPWIFIASVGLEFYLGHVGLEVVSQLL